MSSLKAILKDVPVEWKALKDISLFFNGKGHEKVISENGKFIVVNSKFVSTEGRVVKYSNEQISPVYIDDILIVMSDLPNGRALAKTFLVNENNKYTLNQRIGRISVITEKFIYPKYLNYILNRSSQLLRFDNGVDQTNLKKAEIESIEIPIPYPNDPKKSLAIQQEIVRVLDGLSEQNKVLTAALAQEIAQRKKQYEYYRDELFRFEGKEVEWRKLNDIAFIYDGTHSTPKYQDSGIPFVSVQNIKDIYGTNKFISLEDFEKYKYKPCKNDFFMTRIGDIGTCALIENDNPLAYYVTLALIKKRTDNIMSKYLIHFIESNLGKKELLKRTLINATPIKINLGEIGKINIPVLFPNDKAKFIQEQERIVRLLDQYNEATKNIVAQLEKEIDLRNKQYEYYRNQLLSFPKGNL